MPIRIRSSGIRLDKRKLITEALMKEIGDMAVEEIVSRTESGVDADGKPFKAYSADYAKRKVADGGLGRVNLRGAKGGGHQMLDDIGVVDVSDNSVTVGFRTARKMELATYHDQLGAGKSRVIRRFFDVSKNFPDKVVNLIKKRWK
jgi:hypothetical protein